MKNIIWHDRTVTKSARCSLKHQKPCVLWFTGFSGSGKSTVANAVDKRLHEMKHHTYILDGDNVRHRLNSDLGFSDEDRVENIRRIGEVSHLFVDSGLIVLSAFISPFASDRRMVREMLEEGEFIEIYLNTSLEICEQRDPKGLYKKARAGDIKNFTGIDSAYEPPKNPELTIDTDKHSLEICAELVIDFLRSEEII